MTKGAYRFQLPHRAVAVVASATAISLLGDAGFYVILQTHYARLGLAAFQVGILLSANRWIRLLTNHLAERLTRRLHPSLLLVLALVLGAAVTGAYGLWPFFPALLAARIVWGLCWSLIRQVGVMTCVDTSGGGGRGPASTLGFYGAIARIGSIAGMVAGGCLFDLMHGDVTAFRHTFWILGAAMLLAVIPGATARRPLAGSVSEFQRRRGPARRDRTAALLICGFIISYVGPGVIVPTFGYVLGKYTGPSIFVGAITVGIATLTGITLSVKHIINLLGAPTLGHFVDRIGHRRGTFVFFFAATGALALAALAVNAVLLVCLVILFFVFETGLRVSVLTEASKFGSRAYARYASACDLGAAIGPVAVWSLIGIVPFASLPLVMGAGLYVLGTGALVRLLRPDSAARTPEGPMPPTNLPN